MNLQKENDNIYANLQKRWKGVSAKIGEKAFRSIYGRLVAEADRLIVPETIIRRTVFESVFSEEETPTA